jgi:hypothetical protein
MPTTTPGILQFSQPIYKITESGEWLTEQVQVLRKDGATGNVSVKVTAKTETATVGKDIDKIIWSELSLNENAIELFEENFYELNKSNKIDWGGLSLNKNALLMVVIPLKLLTSSVGNFNFFDIQMSSSIFIS